MIHALSKTVLPSLALALSCSVGCIVPVYFYTDQAAGSATGTGGAGGTGGGGACTPGETRPCYDGPEGTEGKGICKAGVQTCFPDGSSWFSCSGAVKPAIENCATPEDEDCDGQAPPCKGDLLWARRFGDAQDQQWGQAVAVDGQGNIVLTGYFAGVIDFGGGALTSEGATDVFVAKLGPNGDHLWSKRFGDASAQLNYGVAVDKEGNVIFAGSFAGSVDFGGGVLVSKGGRDAFVSKLDSSGVHIWSKRFGDGENQDGLSVAADAAGNIFLAGSFAGTLSDLGTSPFTSAGSRDIFVAKISPSGEHLWSKAFGDVQDQYVSSVTVDTNQNVVISGNLLGSMDLGEGMITNQGPQDVFIAKLANTDGAPLWSNRFGAPGLVLATINMSAVGGASGRTLLTGYMGGVGSVSFGGDIISLASQSGLFVADFDAAGSHAWSKGFGDTINPLSVAVGSFGATDTAGNVALTGYFQGALDFGGGQLASLGNDIYLVKFDAGGAHQWSKRFGDDQDQVGQGVAYDLDGNLILVGSFQGKVDFGNGPLMSAGGQDIFLAKFSP